MSYARFDAEGSDVYVFMDRTHLECCGCSLEGGPPASFRASSTVNMINHLEAHLAAGDKVPDSVIPQLRADDIENFPPTAERIALDAPTPPGGSFRWL